MDLAAIVHTVAASPFFGMPMCGFCEDKALTLAFDLAVSQADIWGFDDGQEKVILCLPLQAHLVRWLLALRIKMAGDVAPGVEWADE
jgi:hypothetical protein